MKIIKIQGANMEKMTPEKFYEKYENVIDNMISAFILDLSQFYPECAKLVEGDDEYRIEFTEQCDNIELTKEFRDDFFRKLDEFYDYDDEFIKKIGLDIIDAGILAFKENVKEIIENPDNHINDLKNIIFYFIMKLANEMINESVSKASDN